MRRIMRHQPANGSGHGPDSSLSGTCASADAGERLARARRPPDAAHVHQPTTGARAPRNMHQSAGINRDPASMATASTRGPHPQHAHHPVRLVAGRWQMNRYSPGAANVTVVVAVDPAGNETSVGRRPCGFRAGPVALVERRVADEPLVVDRVGVDQRDRDRHARRGDHLGRAEVGEMDPDASRGRRRSGPGPGPTPRRSLPDRATGRSRRTGRDALAGGSKSDPSGGPVGRDPSGAGRSARGCLRCRPSRTITPANQRRAAIMVGSVGAREVEPGGDTGRRTGTGRIDREVVAELRRGPIERDLGQPRRLSGTHSMPRSERRSASSIRWPGACARASSR